MPATRWRPAPYRRLSGNPTPMTSMPGRRVLPRNQHRDKNMVTKTTRIVVETVTMQDQCSLPSVSLPLSHCTQVSSSTPSLGMISGIRYSDSGFSPTMRNTGLSGFLRFKPFHPSSYPMNQWTTVSKASCTPILSLSIYSIRFTVLIPLPNIFSIL